MSREWFGQLIAERHLDLTTVTSIDQALLNKWSLALGRRGTDHTEGNEVQTMTSGPEAFEWMYQAIQTTSNKSHFIYLLGWFLDDNLPLWPNGGPSTAIRPLFTLKAKLGVQIRVMLWVQYQKGKFLRDALERFIPREPPDLALLASLLGDASQQTHFQVADWVNALTCNDGRRTGGAIVDWRTASVFGSHHQKLMLVKGSEGLSAFCGGVDINPDRVKVVHPAMGQPLHDVHCRVRGPAARKLIDVFAQRWLSHPLHETIDREQGQLRGLSEPLGPSADKAVVRVASTFNFVKSEKINFNTFRRDACRTERSIRDMLLRAILTATRFIYFEDQYMIGPMQAKALREALRKGVQHITAVITHPSISDLPNVWAARKAFVDYVSSAPGAGDRFKVYYLVSPTSQKPGGPYTYVHAKTWIIDDEFAFIGSANVNGRGWSSDSEVGIGVIDTVASKLSPSQVSTAQALRMKLWANHFDVEPMEVLNGVVSRDLFDKIVEGRSRLRRYDANKERDDPHKLSSQVPVEIVDPVVDDLPSCGQLQGGRKVSPPPQ